MNYDSERAPQSAIEKIRDLNHQYKKATPARDYGVVPAAEYLVTPTRSKLVESGTGTPGLEMMFEIGEGEYKGQEVRITWWLTEGTLPYVKRDLHRLGFKTMELEDFADQKNLEVLTEPKLVKFGVEEYQGSEKNQIRRIRDQAAATPEEPSKSRKR